MTEAEKRVSKERRLYVFVCAQCHKQATSLRRARAKKELCRLCRAGIVANDNQLSLFRVGVDLGDPRGDHTVVTVQCKCGRIYTETEVNQLRVPECFKCGAALPQKVSKL